MRGGEAQVAPASSIEEDWVNISACNENVIWFAAEQPAKGSA